ncbi:chloride channel protein [Conexibacter sp. S30A1]|uniref:chloride channel protein n=1 Tax=Conexibacter sp. S30A1 TaxID=2937800 RepID=UPI00200E3897|nr:chloride channel protein [Conexibacter sp. S30A1]
MESQRSGEHLGDFTATPNLLWLVPVALFIGVLATAIALVLLDMIAFFTNVLYFQRLSLHLVSPYGNRLGWASVAIPVIGGLIVGLIARYGSEQVRGHGIPEAMERILINGSSVQLRLAILKPIASAISIGTGGPFGAEGPIILTGGAFGSIVAQVLPLTAAQRRTLLVAGASAGMSAVFGTPVAATLFGVELLVFEWKPRSMTLIGLASATADALRMLLASAGMVTPQPLFPIPHHAAIAGLALFGAALIGIVVGLASWVMTEAVYGAEDLFRRLEGRLHWMWWPLLGGLVIGLGGMVDARALGVGYDTIHAELLGQLGLGALILLLLTKLTIWSFGLGGGTSGGILAPILMLGAALGGIVGHWLPGTPVGLWSLIGLGAALAGVTRSPFTAIVFAFELTDDPGSLLALLVATSTAQLVSVLVLKRSILTEKVARRGYHVMREYGVDPLETTFVQELTRTDVYTLDPDRQIHSIHLLWGDGTHAHQQRLYPVIDEGGRLLGVLPWSAVRRHHRDASIVGEVMSREVTVAAPDETMRAAADRMAEHQLSVLPVVEPSAGGRLVGLITAEDVLRARRKLLAEEHDAQRLLPHAKQA